VSEAPTLRRCGPDNSDATTSSFPQLPFDSVDLEVVKRMFETNVWGAVTLT
jgi:hypothetical protein